MKDVDGTEYNFDATTGLYWLDTSATRGMSSAHALQMLSSAGWRFPPFAEISQMMAIALPTFDPNPDTAGFLSSDGDDSSLRNLIDVLGGPSFVNPDDGSFELYVKTGIPVDVGGLAGRFALSCMQHYTGNTATAITYCAYSRDTASASTGTWFVADLTPGGLPDLPAVPAIPEPGTYVMLLAGLASVALAGRRRANSST